MLEQIECPAQSPDLNPLHSFGMNWNTWLISRPSHSTSVNDITNAIVTEWAQVPTATLPGKP